MLTESTNEPMWIGDYLIVARGVPSPNWPGLPEGMSGSTWFTSRDDGFWGAVADASWVTADDELALVEIGVVHRDHAHDVRNGFVTILDPSLVDVRLLEPVERLSEEEMAAQSRAMWDAISENPDLHDCVDRWLDEQDEPDEN